MASVNEGSQFYLPPTRLSTTGINSAFTPQPQSITALWLVLICRPAEGRRLSWPGWFGEILRFHVIQPSGQAVCFADVQGREMAQWRWRRHAAGRSSCVVDGQSGIAVDNTQSPPLAVRKFVVSCSRRSSTSVDDVTRPPLIDCLPCCCAGI